MPTTGMSSRRTRREALAYLAAVSLALLYSWHRAHVYVAGLPPFWDARVYGRAFASWTNGFDPYKPNPSTSSVSPLPFVSPPLFLYLMLALSHVLPVRAGVVCYLVLVSAASLISPALLARHYLRSRWMPAPLCLLISWFQPGHYGSQALLSGNLSNLLYALLLATGVAGLKRGQWLPFYAAVLFAASMKPPFLAFLLFPLCAGESQELASCATAMTVLAVALAQRLLVPRYWKEFQAGVVTRVVDQDDAGFGLLGQLRHYRGHLGVLGRCDPNVVVVLLLSGLVLPFLLLRKRPRTKAVDRLWVPGLLLLSILCNPRTLAYDAALATIPALYIVVQFCRSLTPSGWKPVCMGIAAVLAVALLATLGEPAVCLLLSCAVLLVLIPLAFPNTFKGTPLV